MAVVATTPKNFGHRSHFFFLCLDLMPLTAKSKKGIVSQTMHEFRHGALHSGKGGPRVKNRKKAIAIALAESRRKGYK